jgi:thymidylate synthase (FAD)
MKIANTERPKANLCYCSRMSSGSKWFAADGVGSIEVLDVFGSDTTIVNAARVSFNKTVEEIGPADEKLIAYLVKHQHVSPFFHPQIQLRIKMPIFVAREWYRHTVGFARNEVSRRYVDSVPDLWYPQVDGLRARDPKLKQGSKDVAVEGAADILAEIQAHGSASLALYDSLLRRQVAPEVARTVLPQSMYTEFIETASLAAYARLWRLRTDPTAQAEIRTYAEALGSLLAPHFPVSSKILMSTD